MDKEKREKLRKRFLRDPLPRRLGGLAATLGRISSSARNSTDPNVVLNLLKGLNPEKHVPIPEAPNAEPLDYDYLLQLEQDGFEEHPVKNGNRLAKINVRQVLSGIESEAKRKESTGNVTNIYVGGDVKDSTLISGDENEVKR